MVAAQVVPRDAQYVLNMCTKYLARDNIDTRSYFGQYQPGDPRAAIAEAGRFPVIDSFWDGSPASSYPFETATFIWDGKRSPALSVDVTGTFTDLDSPVPLTEV